MGLHKAFLENKKKNINDESFLGIREASKHNFSQA
jgi:hypothetical protein